MAGKYDVRKSLEKHLRIMESADPKSKEWERAEGSFLDARHMAPFNDVPKEDIDGYMNRYNNIGAEHESSGES